MKTLWELVYTFIKIGIFSFGGGYAMIPFFENEISAHHWVLMDDYEKLIAIAQMVPGPFAIDSSAYIGYKVSGILGAIVASVALSLPSFVLSILITKFYIQFKANTYVKLVLSGFRPVVVALLISAAYIIGIKPILSTPLSPDFVLAIKAVFTVASGFLLLKFTKINSMVFIFLFGLIGIILF